MLRRLNDSDAAAKMAISSTRASIARVRPSEFGTSAVYRVPGRRVLPANTPAASAIWGTHFGLTNAETSMTPWPASLRRSTNAILSAVAIRAASFWSPSRGPTSTMRTRVGIVIVVRGSFELDQADVRLDEVAGLAAHGLDSAVAGGAYRQLHLHRFEHDKSLARGNLITGRHLEADDRRRTRRRQRTVRRVAAAARRRCRVDPVGEAVVEDPRDVARHRREHALDLLALADRELARRGFPDLHSSRFPRHDRPHPRRSIHGSAAAA